MSAFLTLSLPSRYCNQYLLSPYTISITLEKIILRIGEFIIYSKFLKMKRKVPSKRTQYCWPTTRNIDGSSILSPFAWNHNNVGTCCVEFETGQTFSATSPNISIVLWPAKRGATMLRSFAGNHNNVGLVKTSAHTQNNLKIFIWHSKYCLVIPCVFSLQFANNVIEVPLLFPTSCPCLVFPRFALSILK